MKTKMYCKHLKVNLICFNFLVLIIKTFFTHLSYQPLSQFIKMISIIPDLFGKAKKKILKNENLAIGDGEPTISSRRVLGYSPNLYEPQNIGESFVFFLKCCFFCSSLNHPSHCFCRTDPFPHRVICICSQSAPRTLHC